MHHGAVNISGIDFEMLELRNLIDVDRLQVIQDEFTHQTGLGMITVDSMGVPVTEASGFSPLCQFLRQDPEFRKRCFACDAHGGFQAALQNNPFVYRCHAGLVDFSVPILAGRQYLGAIMAGQVYLQRGTEHLGHIIGSTKFEPDTQEHVQGLYQEVKVVDRTSLDRAAARIIQLANEALAPHQRIINLGPATLSPASSVESTTEAREVDPDGVSLEELPARSTDPMVPTAVGELDEALDWEAWAENLERANIAGNLTLLSDHLDALMPRWSQKLPPAAIAPFEDMMMGLASSRGPRAGKEVSRVVIEQRNRRKNGMNRYAVQTYCERLLVTLHNLAEPAIPVAERTIETLVNEIDKDPTPFRTLAKGAEFLAWSESHFARQFKLATGQSFIQYVTRKRLDRAKFLLIHTDLPILRIAAALRFQPPNYFSRAFRKVEGTTPTAYREDHRPKESHA